MTTGTGGRTGFGNDAGAADAKERTMTVNATLDDEDRPAGEVPALPVDFTRTAAQRPAPRDLRYDLIPV
ncbi:hypothetical protein [Cellulomonas sp.]|uniref:hypothetical protein n=1 Tax=Cellulomonas sp. TaxID=40001 RepID=UPI001B0A43F2|nr:hypothetical protein [Cellulomonas sp.]MBO9554907.1 hypothetical protein [Cellulomonas sp.]